MRRLSRLAPLVIAIALPGLSAPPAEPVRDIPIVSWQAPPFWKPARTALKAFPEAEVAAAVTADLTTPMPFVAVTPCRIVDTRRLPPGEFNEPALASRVERTFTLPNGPCPGLPANAGAWSLNVTVVPAGVATSGGHLTVYPAGSSRPVVATLSYAGGAVAQVVANAAIVPAGAGGGITVFTPDSTHLIIDVNGYYRPAGTRPAADCWSLNERLLTNDLPVTLTFEASNSDDSAWVTKTDTDWYFTAPQEGFYQVTAQASVQGAGTPTDVEIGIRISPNTGDDYTINYHRARGTDIASITQLLRLVPGDKIRAYFVSHSGGSPRLLCFGGWGCWAQVHYIGP